MSSRLDRVTDWSKYFKQSDFRVSELAKICGVSERQLHRYFMQKFGRSPREWMDARRFEQARSSLSSGGTIKEAAFDAGFSHVSAFSYAFKERYGSTPGSFCAGAESG